jgi:Protein of unknown function (DUF3800)
MLYRCFLDDSKDQTQSKILVSAGFIGDKQQWHSLRIAWKKILKRNGIDYFKTSEYKMLTGEFAKFRSYPKPAGREKAREIRNKLQSVLEAHRGIAAVGIAIPMVDYNKVCERPEAAEIFRGGPYHRALEAVLLEAVRCVRRLPGENLVAFVHDDGYDFDELRAVYNSFKINNPKLAKYMTGFQSLSDKDHPPLQLADMAANFTLAAASEWLINGRRTVEPKEMRANVQKLGIWTGHVMWSVLKCNLIRFGVPVPVDLQAKEYG